jgi:hypothetical protein
MFSCSASFDSLRWLFLERQPCRLIRLLEKIVHRLAPEQPRISLAHDLVKALLRVLPPHLLILQQH